MSEWSGTSAGRPASPQRGSPGPANSPVAPPMAITRPVRPASTSEVTRSRPYWATARSNVAWPRPSASESAKCGSAWMSRTGPENDASCCPPCRIVTSKPRSRSPFTTSGPVGPVPPMTSAVLTARLAFGMSRGFGPATTRLVTAPIPSARSVTSSPGASGGGSRRPRRPHCSARQPPAHVPEASRSPGRTQAPRDAYATSEPNDQAMLDRLSRPISTPLTDETSARSYVSPRRRSASSSTVTSQGPTVLAASLAFAIPRPRRISRAPRSRADQSLKMVNAAMWSNASSGDRSRPLVPITAATSSSKSSSSQPGGTGTSAPVATTALVLEK